MSVTHNITCGQCALRAPESDVCMLFRCKIPGLDKGCPSGTMQVFKCENCGSILLSSGVVYDLTDPENGHILCSDCASKSNTCDMCRHNTGCSFMESSDPTPKLIQKQVAINGGYAVTQIMNPERIRNTCKKGCPCFSDEFGCSRQNNWCNNHSYKL